MQKRAGVLRRLQEQDVVVFLGDVVAERAVAGRDQMRVRVHQAGEDRALRILSPIHRGPVGDANIGLATEAAGRSPPTGKAAWLVGPAPGAPGGRAAGAAGKGCGVLGMPAASSRRGANAGASRGP